MPRINPVSDQEKGIGARLREFRLTRALSQVAFSRPLEIDAGRLASYESGRVPLPFLVASKLVESFSLNLRWLVLGEGPKIWPITISEKVTSQIHRRARLSDVYSTIIGPLYDQALRRDAQHAETTTTNLEALEAYWKEAGAPTLGVITSEDLAVICSQLIQATASRIPPHLFQQLYAVVIKALSEFDASVGAESTAFRSVVLPESISKGLTKDYAERNFVAVASSLLDDLLARAKRATDARGAKGDLARILGVPPSRISEWFHGKGKPSAEATLLLLSWVSAMEENNSGCGDVGAPPQPETRSDRKHENPQKSGPP